MNREDSEECVNDTWFSVWNSSPPHRPVNLAGYLAKIVRNISINRYNKKNAAKRGGGSMAVALDELSECVAGRGRVEDNLEMELVTEVISDYLDSQNQTRRWIFLQRYFYLADIKEIAGRLDMKEGTVKSVLCRMRRQLRDYLEMEDVM